MNSTMPHDRLLLVFGALWTVLSCGAKNGNDVLPSITEDHETMTKGTGESSPESSSFTPSSSDSTTMQPGACRNGKVEDGEGCDDGNLLDGDGCNNDCTISATLLWEHYISDHPAVTDLAVDATDHVVVGGATRGAAAHQWVARFNPDLMLDWSKVYDSDQSGMVAGVAVDADAIFAVGAVDTPDGHDTWVSRLDFQGTSAWETTSGVAGQDYATDAAITEVGDVLVAGLMTVNGETSLSLLQCDSKGSLGWQTLFPLNKDVGVVFPLGPGMTVVDDRVIAGFARWQGDMTSELVIAYPVGGSDPTWVFDIPQTAGYVLGVAMSSGDILVTGSSQSIMAVHRIGARGDVMWYSEDCTGESGREIAVDSQGDIVVIGDGPGANGRNIRLCKFDSAGKLKWGKDLDGPGAGDDLGYTLAIGARNRIIAGGSVSNENGERDGWLAVFSP